MEKCRIILFVFCIAHVHSLKVIIGSNHKTGSAVSGYTQDALLKAKCARIQPILIHQVAEDIQNSTKYIIFTRNPFHMIVSGYLYHRRASEIWTKQSIPVTPIKQGHHLLHTDAFFHNITPPKSTESYANYLKRLSIRDGIMAEIIRCQFREFPHLQKNAENAHYLNVLEICLGDLMKSQMEYHTEMHQIFVFLGIDDACSRELHVILDPEGPDTFHPHGTQDDPLNRSMLMEFARILDVDHFNGSIGRLEVEVGCGMNT